MASPSDLLEIIRAKGAKARRLLVLGHNPGLEEIASWLVAPNSDENALSRLKEKFPTAGLARFRFDGPWAALRLQGPGCWSSSGRGTFREPVDIWAHVAAEGRSAADRLLDLIRRRIRQLTRLPGRATSLSAGRRRGDHRSGASSCTARVICRR